ncbi:MAG: serine/threonine-protein kinase [Myxococcales bacterium]
MTQESAQHRRAPATSNDGAADSRAHDVDTTGTHIPLAPGSTFARYEITRCIGVGGMGAVFEATHTLLKKRVALKALHANLSRAEAARDRFLREAETVARIRHPNVVDITDVGVERGMPYLVMEFLEGEDVASLLDRGSLEPAVVADIVVPIASGLCAVHRLGIVHRDIKPENIFLARDNHGEVVPKLVDFGVSKDLGALGSNAPPLHTVTGTPHYMSPEQARGAATLDGRTDQYALGILLYQSLSGARPYDAESLLELMHLIDQGHFKPLRSAAPEVPAELEAIVHRAMARNPWERFESMAAFGRALLPFASERTRFTYERDFHDNAVPQSSLSQKDALLHERLSANTMPVEAFDRAKATVPRDTSSGVRIRKEMGQALQSNESTQRTESKPAARERWLWGALALVIGLGALIAWLEFGQGTAPIAQPAPKSESPSASAAAPQAPAPAAASAPVPAAPVAAPAPALPVAEPPTNAPAAAPDDVTSERPAARRRKPARPVARPSSTTPQPAPAAAPLDIQLSR